MEKNKSDRPSGGSAGSGDPLIYEARAQIAAARRRTEALVAAGQLTPTSASGPSTPLQQTLPRYRLLSEIHRGGQGVVYLAIQESTARQVAVKIFRRGAAGSPSEAARFQREVDVLSRLKHPNVVTIHDCGRAGDDVFLVMDYVAGLPLDGYIAQENPSLVETLVLFAKICDGVNAAHLRGVIHRDLKPGNIRIGHDGEPRILDFGLAKLEPDAPGASSTEAMTITGQFIGSLPWASPEQAAGRSESLDVRTDVYSLGVIFYQLLTGRFPYPVSGRMDDVVRNITFTSPARPSSIDRTVGNEVETILLKCLAKEPERRYQSAGELGRDIRRYLAGEPIEAKRDSASYLLRKQLRQNWIAVAVTLGFVALLASGLVTSSAFWFRAEHALAEQEAQRKLAEVRAEQNQRIADFQARMLSEIDVESMGRGIKEQLREQVRSSLERGSVGGASDRRPRTAAEVEAELAAFDERVGPVQAADVARRVLDEYVLRRAADSSAAEFSDQPLVQAHLSAAIGDAYCTLGSYGEAEPYLREALDTHRRLLGDEHGRTLKSISSRGIALQQSGKLAEAEPYLREVLDTRRRLLGDEHPDTLRSLHNLAGLLYLTGQPAAAESHHRQVLEIRRRVLGDEHRDTLHSLRNLSNSLRATGKFAEAEPYCREALATSKRVLGDRHPDVADALSNLGGVLNDLEKYEEAEPALRKAVALRRDLRGNEHPEVAVALSILGTSLHDAAKLAESEQVLREALALRRRLFGEEHHLVAQSMSNLGLLLEDKGELLEAESQLRDALARFRKLLGEEHPAVAQSLKRLGWVLHKKGDDVEAELMLREALAQRRKLLGNQHPHVGGSLNDLGWVLADQGRCADAEPLLREALSIVEKRFAAGHGNVEKPRIRLAECLTQVGTFAEAEALLGKSLEALSGHPNPPPDLETRIFSAQIELYDAWKTSEPDRGFEAKAEEWRGKLAALKASGTTLSH